VCETPLITCLADKDPHDRLCLSGSTGDSRELPGETDRPASGSAETIAEGVAVAVTDNGRASRCGDAALDAAVLLASCMKCWCCRGCG